MSNDDFSFEEKELDEEKNEDLIGYYDKIKGYQGGEFPNQEMNYTPLFSYTYIDIGKTDYHFHRPEFDGTDRRAYFEKLKQYSQEEVHFLVHDAHHRDRIKLTDDISQPEFALVSEIFGVPIKDENRPVIGHFRLYHVELTKQDVLDIQTGKDVKNPRIFFFLDKFCTCHILFYDPFHKIHPMGKSTIESLLKQFEE